MNVLVPIIIAIGKSATVIDVQLANAEVPIYRVLLNCPDCKVSDWQPLNALESICMAFGKDVFVKVLRIRKASKGIIVQLLGFALSLGLYLLNIYVLSPNVNESINVAMIITPYYIDTILAEYADQFVAVLNESNRDDFTYIDPKVPVNPLLDIGVL